MEISVSILNSLDRIQDVVKLNNTSCDYLHIDVMDGNFVPDTQFTIEEIKNLINICKKKIDIHLMVNNPIVYIEKLLNFNIEYITFHKEINDDLDNLIDILKANNIKAGISIKPNTNVSEIIKYLDKVDLVLIMSVEPGKGGQAFMPSVLDNFNILKEKINNNTIISIDGGINDSNINKIKEYPIDMVVVGSYITNSDNYNEAIKKIL